MPPLGFELGRTNHTVLDRVRLTTLAWRRNSRIANDSVNHFGTQRRESDLNTRVLADAAVPAQSLDQAREIPPTVRRRIERRRGKPPPCSRLLGDATSEASRLSVSNRARSPIYMSHHHCRSLLRRARLALLTGRRKTRIAQLLTLTFEADAFISTQSWQGSMAVTSFRGSTRRPR